MEKEKVFMSTQLCAVLPPMVCKLAIFLVNWQNSPTGIMLYEHRFARTLKMSEQEIRLCIQTLMNLKLIDLTNVDGKFRIEFNVDEWKKYMKIPMDRVVEHEGYKMATKVTYYQSETPSSTAEMSTEQLEKMIQMMTAQLNERKEVARLIKTASEPQDDLPF